MTNSTSDVFNVGNDNEISIKYLAEKILELTNSNSKIIFKDLPKDDPKQRKPDLTKIKDKFNYEPKFSLEEGLKITINWVENNYK
jgi:nucleoside-diphosphate-sugar epimerase